MKRFWKGLGATLGVGLLAAAFLMLAPAAQAPLEEIGMETAQTTPAVPVRDAANAGERLSANSELTQTMCFSRCGHSVTRRIHPPEALAGADFSAVQAYYALWQIEDFSAAAVSMRREIPLYCPMHQVAGVNEAGEVVLSENQYGDGMAVVAETQWRLDDFPEDMRQALLLGKGFDSRDAALDWLAAH